MADFFDRSLGIALVMATLGFWYWSLGSVSIETVTSPKVEAFYWATIIFSQTLGTALGDRMASTGRGYHGSALAIAVALAVARTFFSDEDYAL